MIASETLIRQAKALIGLCRERNLRVAVAESCTGGLVCALLTEIAGSSAVLDRGFITYSNAAKIEMLGVSEALIAAYGAVSEEIASAMAKGALVHSLADIGVSITGIAGPGGGSLEKPVGLVHLGCTAFGFSWHEKPLFGALSRSAIREKSAEAALRLMMSAAQKSP